MDVGNLSLGRDPMARENTDGRLIRAQCVFGVATSDGEGYGAALQKREARPLRCDTAIAGFVWMIFFLMKTRTIRLGSRDELSL